MNITSIGDYQHRDTIEALSDLLARARAGRLKGFMFTIKTGRGRHLMGLTGDYWDNPADALGPATRLEYKVNQLISAQDDEPRTDFSPL